MISQDEKNVHRLEKQGRSEWILLNRDEETVKKNGKLKKKQNLAVTVYLSYSAELFCNKEESESQKKKKPTMS